MLISIWTGFARGLLLGLLAGIIAGSVEATSIMLDAPVWRAALVEAGLYAVIVDALASAAVCALAGGAFAVGLAARSSQLASRRVGALYVSGVAGLVTALDGLLWAFRANDSDPAAGVPLHTGALILALAIGLGALTFPAALSFAAPLLTSTKRVAAVGLIGAISLSLVLPVQIVFEARQNAVETNSGTRLTAFDPGLFGSALAADFERGLKRALVVGGADRTSRPNVLLITVDGLRADHLGACGNEWIKTPSIDLLAAHSTLSCTMYSQQPQTNPALASLFTSTYPTVHGVRVHMVDRLADAFDTLAEVLQRNGYTTAAVIPWTSLEPAFSGFHQGFQTYEAFVINEPAVLKNPATAALAGVYRRITDQVALGSAVEAMLGMREGTEAQIDGRADVTASAAIEWLASAGDSPFFLWVHYFDPHYPFTPPEPWDQLYEGGREYDGRYDGGMGFVYEMRAGVFAPGPRDVAYLRALYASEVSYADYYIGQMLGFLARSGRLENTIVVLTADHGEALGERGESWPAGDNWLHGDDLYAAGIQLPLVVYNPGIATDQRSLDVPVQQIDIMPTVLDLLGLPIPRQAQGRSLVPLLLGQEDGTDRVALSVLGDDSQRSIVTSDGWKLIVKRNPGVPELYYLPVDKDERRNLAGIYAERAAALAQQIESRLSGASTGR